MHPVVKKTSGSIFSVFDSYLARKQNFLLLLSVEIQAQDLMFAKNFMTMTEFINVLRMH